MKSLFQHALSPLTPRRQASKWLYLNIFLCYYAPENQHRQKNHLANLFPVTEADPGVSKRLQKGLCTSRTVTWEKVKREHGHTHAQRDARAQRRAQARTSEHKRAQARTWVCVMLCCPAQSTCARGAGAGDVWNVHTEVFQRATHTPRPEKRSEDKRKEEKTRRNF